jgi:hypothetical protein
MAMLVVPPAPDLRTVGRPRRVASNYRDAFEHDLPLREGVLADDQVLRVRLLTRKVPLPAGAAAMLKSTVRRRENS